LPQFHIYDRVIFASIPLEIHLTPCDNSNGYVMVGIAPRVRSVDHHFHIDVRVRGGLFRSPETRLGIWQIIQINSLLYSQSHALHDSGDAIAHGLRCLGRMAGDCEFIAARAAGVHIMHLMWPSFFIAAMLS